VALQRVALAVGVLLVVAAEFGPLADLSFDSLTMHLLQNVMLAEWAPLLIAYGLARSVGVSVSPWIALPVWALTYYGWHAPPIYDMALRNPDTLLHLEHLCYFATGLLFWLPVAQGRVSDGASAAYVFAAFAAMAPLGLLLALLPSPVYDFYDGHWGLTALEDQQIAGVTMAAEQAIVFFALFAFYVTRYMRENA
jgi:putative membrane protein